MAAQQEVCVDCIPSSSSVATTTSTAPAPAPAAAPAVGAAAPVPAAESSAAAAPTDPILPPPITTPHVLIEFCDRCRWAPRASWTQTELMLTFPPPLLRTVSLQPLNTPETGGRFRVWVDLGNGAQLVWDRKTEGGFPELKVLKQRIRNLVQPDLSLGHSDVKKL